MLALWVHNPSTVVGCTYWGVSTAKEHAKRMIDTNNKKQQQQPPKTTTGPLSPIFTASRARL